MKQSLLMRIILSSAALLTLPFWILAGSAHAEAEPEEILLSNFKILSENHSSSSPKASVQKTNADFDQIHALDWQTLDENSSLSRLSEEESAGDALAISRSSNLQSASSESSLATSDTQRILSNPQAAIDPIAPPAQSATTAVDIAQVEETETDDEEDTEAETDDFSDPVTPEFTGDTLRFTVTGTRNFIPVRELPATVTVFELEDFEFYQFQNLRDLLRYEPGVSVRDNLQFGIQDVNIRGLEGNRILFQLDGIRLPERFEFGPFNLGRGDFVDFATLQAVEILRGPASTLFGSDALGGVVAYRSLEPRDLLGDDDDFAADVSSIYISETGGLDNVGRLALRHENSEAVFVISRRDGRETDSFADDDFVDSIDAEGTTLYGNFVQRLSPVSNISFIAEDLSRYTNRVEADGNLSLNLTEEEDILIDRTRLSLTYEYDDPESESFLNFARAQVFYQDAVITELLRETRASGSAFRGDPVFRDTENEFVSDSYGGDIQLRSDFSTGTVDHRLTYGLDVSNTFNSRPRDRVETSLITGESTRVIPPDVFPVKDFPDGETLRLGAYVQNEMEIGQFDIIAGLRFDYYDLTTDPDQDFNRNGAESVDLNASALSPRIAVLYEATPEISLYGQYARGFRAPLYSEINSGFTNLTGSFFKYETLSNPDLEPETSNSFEVGVRGNFPQFDFRVTGFYNTYDNFIETFVLTGQRCLIPNADPCPTLPPFQGGSQTVNQFQTQNVAEAEIYGVEVGGEYRFSPDGTGFSILGSLAWAEGNNTTDDEPLSTVDPITAVLGLRYRAPEDLWRAEFISTIVGQARVGDDVDTFVPDTYAVFDLIGSYNPIPNLGLSLGIYNLFDTEYYIYSDVRNQPDDAPDIQRFSQPGINVRFGVSYRF
ncbi:TonB-dependent hemoglobin/transferrin/lactoferrin family receptor [Oscillatoria sp. CS-180]|uniref:TonB-dependent hemoglobin/transferrin/lactoferrin family receptor n=1 Tax=Oscillatoria sp. CS-180 TaxID=3021720 RepID=UPI0023302E10|nr:TonB-dependent hemoglobin/transferrin/lactoferrin family receptor [Oscillatoria sp. CS-180]MDB9525528.1 TonB-dependent hemoglobin/transferrin/lactoferrin family receptor [Oscillatoria sp. CS-180]